MLHAIEKNKSKLYERYWGVQDFSVRGNITAEDEITSTLFGPLDFMTPSDVWCIARKILGDNILVEEPTPTKFELKFWNKEGIEPDAELIFFQNNMSEDIPIVAILFELKWNALEGIDEDGKYQLDKQWDAFKFKELSGCDAYHLFIAKGNAVEKVKARRGGEGDKLTCLTWDEVRDRLCASDEKMDGCTVYRWAHLVNNFLQFAITRPFGGFGKSTEDVPEGFGCYAFPDFAALTPPLFWDDHWFARLEKLLPSEIPLHQPLFFTEKNHD